MKDKDTKLIWESYLSEAIGFPKEGGDRWPDGSKMEPERARHLDQLRARDEKHDVAAKVLEIHDWDIKWEDGKWWRYDDAIPEPRPVTGDEHWDIMKIERPEDYAEYRRKSKGPDRDYQDSGDRPSFGVMG